MRSKRKMNLLAPKPVHPRAVRTHGLFGTSFLRQHMMIDDRWTPNSLTEQFKGMADLLNKSLVFKKMETAHDRKRYQREIRNLRAQVRDGRTKLQMSMTGDNTKQVRNFLINHKDMQRLYQKMPIHMVVDNINQRTFVMRKERDRLRARLECLKSDYESKLIEKANIENRIKYENEFVLEEEYKSREFRKKIENSKVRLRSIKTINNAYKKMIQVLRHDGIFYDPILRSLNNDMEDQGNFIKHILFLGTPAIQKFKQLSEEYRQMEDKSRKNMQAKLQWVANYRKEAQAKKSSIQAKAKEEDFTQLSERYVRETKSMQFLKDELETIENTIKQVKFATLCSQAKEIYPRIKSQVDSNEKLKKMIANDMLIHDTLETKLNRAQVLEGVLVNNLSEEEMNRMTRIKDLKQAIKEEEEYEAKTMAHMKNRAKFIVLLRFTLWNINEILRHVDRAPKVTRMTYPNSYLHLPLLKFEMLTMRAVPPEPYEGNIDTLMQLVKKKLRKLMSAYQKELTKETMDRYVNEYHITFLESMETDDLSDEDETQRKLPDEEDDLLQDVKITQNVPNRRSIKAQSIRLVEEKRKDSDIN